MIKQLQAVTVPDDFCYWFHPDLKLIDPRMQDGKECGYSREEWQKMQDDGGIQINLEVYQYEDIPEISDEDMANWSNWKPSPPTSEHFLLCAYDTENCDIVLWWAKIKEPAND
ncbi:hypothetical protein [Acinetobacter towneri]|uniref:hypothetical protein n=1 Tax=Acinetobacter towneri TaxID=202956 RepID=UPI0034D79362